MRKMTMAVVRAAASVWTPVVVCAALLLWAMALDVAAFLFPVSVPEWPFHIDLARYAVCALLCLCAVLSVADFWRRRWWRGIVRIASLFFVGFAFLRWCGFAWNDYQRHNLTPSLSIRIVMDGKTIGMCGDVALRAPEDVYDLVRPVVRKLRLVKVVFELGNDNITAEDFANNFFNQCTAAGAWKFAFNISGMECGDFIAMPPRVYGGHNMGPPAVKIAPDGTCTYTAAWRGEEEEGKAAADAFDAPEEVVYREGGSMVLVLASLACSLSDIVDVVCSLSAFNHEVDLLFM